MSSDGSTLLFGALPVELRFSTEEKQSLKRFVRALSRRVAGHHAFTCLITDDRELQRLNLQFLHHDYPTDVLSFPAANETAGLGEIAISAERAGVQARESGHDRIHEICILMLHGVLHLTGMDHTRDHGEMERAEEEWRSELGLPVALIGRARAGGQQS